MGTKLTNGNILRFAMVACLLMTSCGTEVPFPRCVSGSNFNSNTTIAVTAYYSEGNVDAFKADNGEIGNGSTPGATKQITRWKDTGLITDGEEIIIKITGAWVPWAKDGEKTSSPVAVNSGIARPTDLSDEFYDAVVPVNRVCGPFIMTTRKAGSCSNLECYHLPSSDDEGRRQYTRPCWMENGYGAYLLFQRPGDENPNATLDRIEYPKSPTTHLGYQSTDAAAGDSYSSTDKIFDSDCKKIKPERGWKIYVKILDNYYYDNAGGYSLEFTKGVIQGKGSDIFETVRRLVRTELDKAGEAVFKNIVSNKSFRTFVLSLATLFILVTALSYLLGVVRSSLADLVVRILKIVLVVMLISPNSWDFFHNHLLKLFTKGVDEIIALINSHATNQKFDAGSPFSFMDVMIRDKIFATVVWEAKARALITADKVSIFALLIIGIAVLFYIGLCLYGFIIYLTAFVGITFLISLMPILFAGILFSRFKSLFDGWLTQCISFSMQAILMFTLIAMFGSLIMHYYYRIFGFTACYNEWIHAKIYALGIKIIDQKYYEWTPGQEYDPIVIRIGGIDNQENQGIARYRFTGGGSVIKVPPDYKHEDFRYVDIPFLDPDTKTSAPPGGVSLKDEKTQLRRIAELTNSLVAAERSVSIARLTGHIEKELGDLQKSKSVTADQKKKFSDILADTQYGNENTRWDNGKLKDALVNHLTSGVIASNANPSTPYTELEKQYDYSIIKSIRQGYIVMWPEVFGLILVAFLVWQMRAFVQSVAVVLSGGGMMSTTIASMYDEGFTRIFSKMPVFGRAIEMVDYGVDSLRVMARARIEGVASAVVKAPEKMLGRVPVVGGAMETVIRGVRGVASSVTAPHDEAEMYSMRSISPDFDYARAWLGAHLGFSPLDALKYMGSYAVGSSTGGLMHNIKHDREALISNLRTLTKGVDKYKPSPYVASEREDEDDVFTPREGNMGFSQANIRDVFGGDFDQGMGGAAPSGMQELFDSSGNIHVHAENFDRAVSTLHGLTVMRKNAEDSRALQKIDHDIDVLKGAITRMALEHRAEIPASMQEFVTSDGVDFSGLMITGAMHRLQQQSAENQEGWSDVGSDVESLEIQARDMEDTSLLIGTNEEAVDLEHTESRQDGAYITTNEFRLDVPPDTEGATESGAPHPDPEEEQARTLEEAHRAYVSAFDEARITEDMGATEDMDAAAEEGSSVPALEGHKDGERDDHQQLEAEGESLRREGPEDYCDGITNLFGEKGEADSAEAEADAEGRPVPVQEADDTKGELPQEEDSAEGELEDYCDGIANLFGEKGEADSAEAEADAEGRPVQEADDTEEELPQEGDSAEAEADAEGRPVQEADDTKEELPQEADSAEAEGRPVQEADDTEEELPQEGDSAEAEADAEGRPVQEADDTEEELSQEADSAEAEAGSIEADSSTEGASPFGDDTSPPDSEELEDYCDGLENLFGEGDQFDVERQMGEGEQFAVVDQHETKVDPIIKPKDTRESVRASKSSSAKGVKSSKTKQQEQKEDVLDAGGEGGLKKEHEKEEHVGSSQDGKRGKAKKAKSSTFAGIGHSIKDTLEKEVRTQLSSILKKLGFDGNILKTSTEGEELRSKEYESYIGELESQVADLKKMLERENVDRGVKSDIRSEIDSLEKKISELKRGFKGGA